MTDPPRQPHQYLQEAFEALEAERRVTADEIDAWKTFASRIRAIGLGLSSSHPSSSSPSQPPAAVVRERTTVTRASPTATRPFRTAFEETVRSVDVADEYESDPADHIAAELGEDVAAVVYGSRSPPSSFHATVLNAATRVLQNRRAVLEAVDREASSLREYDSDLRAVRETLVVCDEVVTDGPAGRLRDYHGELEDLRGTCQDIAIERQNALQDSHGEAGDRLDFVEYLYRDCTVTHPVLAAVAETDDDLAQLQRRIRRGIGDFASDGNFS